MELLPLEALLKTGPIDHADWTYRFFLGWILRVRFRLILSLLPKCRVQRLLEVGYGSGIFLPELARHCEELNGLDIHGHHREVETILWRYGVEVKLHSASMQRIPYPDQCFDSIVSVSALEFVESADEAFAEIRRVLKEGGVFVFVTPGHSWILDLGLKLLSGAEAEKDFERRREGVIPAAKKYFRILDVRVFPKILGSILPVYTAMKVCR